MNYVHLNALQFFAISILKKVIKSNRSTSKENRAVLQSFLSAFSVDFATNSFGNVKVTQKFFIFDQTATTTTTNSLILRQILCLC